MNFLLFIILFLGLPLAGLIYLLRGKLWRWMLLRLTFAGMPVFVYAALFMNILGAGRFWYYDPALALGAKIGHLPIESYAFLVLQVALAGLFALWLWHQFYPGEFMAES